MGWLAQRWESDPDWTLLDAFALFGAPNDLNQNLTADVVTTDGTFYVRVHLWNNLTPDATRLQSVSVTAIPEPASLTLLGLLGGLAFVRRSVAVR